MAKKNKKLVIIGNTDNARLIKYYFDTDSEYKVVGFSVHREYITEEKIEGLPVVPLEEITGRYPVLEVEAFVAVGYSKMNRVREKLYTECKSLGYKMASYISSYCTNLSQFSFGDNCLILEGNIIQPYVRIGNNVVMWTGNSIAHHTTIEDHCYITSHVVISGFATIKANCFLGINSAIRDGVTIGPGTLIGGGAIIMKDTVREGVYLPAKSILHEKKSTEIVI